MLAARARVLTTEGDDLEGTVEVAERALGDGRLAAESVVWVAWSYAIYALITADRLGAAVREVDRSLEAAVARASVGWYCTALMLRAEAAPALGADRPRACGRRDGGAGRARPRAAAAPDLGCVPRGRAARRRRSGGGGAHLRRSGPGRRARRPHPLLPAPLRARPSSARRGRHRGRRRGPARARRARAALEGGQPRAATRGGSPPCGACGGSAATRRRVRWPPVRSREAARWPSPRARCLAELALGLAEDDRARAGEHFAAAAAVDEPATALLRVEALIELGRTIRQQGERARARPPLREALDGGREAARDPVRARGRGRAARRPRAPAEADARGRRAHAERAPDRGARGGGFIEPRDRGVAVPVSSDGRDPPHERLPATWDLLAP